MLVQAEVPVVDLVVVPASVPVRHQPNQSKNQFMLIYTVMVLYAKMWMNVNLGFIIVIIIYSKHVIIESQVFIAIAHLVQEEATILVYAKI